MITCHLGNGCSMAALKGGRSIDTTMGLTPLEGLVMGTRSGDLDPSVVFFLVNRRGYDIDKVERLLNKESGILGVSGLTNDVKTVLDASRKGNERAKLALDIFSYRVKKYIGAYMAALGGLDCIVFTAGIGERSAEVRKMICAGLQDIGIQIDHDLNKRCYSCEMVVSSEKSRVKVVVIPTDEEHVIASETYRIASKKKG
jgi:acetate kinase